MLGTLFVCRSEPGIIARCAVHSERRISTHSIADIGNNGHQISDGNDARKPGSAYGGPSLDAPTREPGRRPVGGSSLQRGQQCAQCVGALCDYPLPSRSRCSLASGAPSSRALSFHLRASVILGCTPGVPSASARADRRWRHHARRFPGMCDRRKRKRCRCGGQEREGSSHR